MSVLIARVKDKNGPGYHELWLQGDGNFLQVHTVWPVGDKRRYPWKNAANERVVYPSAPEPGPQRTPEGATQIDGRAFRDSAGHWPALGATYMYAAHAVVADRGRFIANLDWLSAQGCHYIRFLTMVGPNSYWPFAIKPRSWSAYDDVAQLAWDRKMRIQPVIFADVDHAQPGDLDAYALAVCDWTRDWQSQVLCIEAANESNLNGLSNQELVSVCRVLADNTSIPFAASSPTGSHDVDAGLTQLYEVDGCRSTLAVPHWDRDQGEEMHRLIRQPWHYVGLEGGSLPNACLNNEPAGAGLTTDKQGGVTIPEQFGAAALTSFVCGAAAYCWHSEAGVKGVSADGSRLVDFDMIPRGAEMWESMRASVAHLPGDISNGHRQNHYWSGHPLSPSLDEQLWPGLPAGSPGCTRAYASLAQGQWYIPILGIRSSVTITPNRDVLAKLIRVRDGVELDAFPISRGVSVVIAEGGPHDRNRLLILEDA